MVAADPSQPKRLSILGSTGSIGTQTLDVVRHFPDRFEVLALTTRSNIELLKRQALEFRPRFLAISDAARVDELLHVAREIGAQILTGVEGLEETAVAGPPDLVVVATVGFAGVAPTLRAASEGVDIALANKEALVCAGDLITAAARQSGARLLPVDSEHHAIAQCLEGRPSHHVRRLILTASGGALRHLSRDELAHVTRDDVLRHPNWTMGAKITVDSATMMNKGFEVIEAHHLFGTPVENIDVVIHPQSIVHSMVEFLDGSILAQLGPTDMRMPIQSALLHPVCTPGVVPRLELQQMASLEFREPAPQRYPMLALAYEAARHGPLLCTALNAINEEAVGAFLDSRLHYLELEDMVTEEFHRWAAVLQDRSAIQIHPTLSDLIQQDQQAREAVRQ